MKASTEGKMFSSSSNVVGNNPRGSSFETQHRCFYIDLVAFVDRQPGHLSCVRGQENLVESKESRITKEHVERSRESTKESKNINHGTESMLFSILRKLCVEDDVAVPLNLVGEKSLVLLLLWNVNIQWKVNFWLTPRRHVEFL